MKRFSALIALIALMALMTAGMPAANASVVEDFEGYAAGTDLKDGVGGWATVNTNTEMKVEIDPASEENRAAFLRRTGSPATAGRYLTLGSNTVADGSVVEFSLRFYMDARPDHGFGFSSIAAPGPPAGTGAGTQLNVHFRLINASNDLQYWHANGTLVLARNLSLATWYELTCVVDNELKVVTNIYLQGGGQYPEKTLLSAGPWPFNAAVVPATDLVTFFMFSRGLTTRVRIDDLRITPAAAPSLSCAGFEPPMDERTVTVKKHRALPLKMTLRDADGNPVTGADIQAPPVVQVVFQPVSGEPVDVTDDVLSPGQRTEGNLFTYEDGLWRFNLATKNYTAPGTYKVSVTTGDLAEYIVQPTCEASFVIE